MKFVVLLLAPLALAGGAARARADAAATGFYSGKAFHPLAVDKDHVAVRHAPGAAAEPRAAILTQAEAAAFAQVGVDVVPRAKVRAEDEIVGYPVWFDRAAGAVAVLTHEIVVRVATPEAEKQIRQQQGFADVAALTLAPGVFLAKFTSPMAALSAANELYKGKDVLYAHPNFLVPKSFRAAGPAGEPFFSHQWHLENTGQFAGAVAGADIHVKGAWDITQGDPDVVVAILDGGFETSHPDLEAAWKRNKAEIPGNGVDDDGNGFVDDVNGWNFYTKTNDPSQGILNDHGTAVAGLVGARVNGKGVTGVCPKCSLVPVALAWTVAEDAAAFYYAQKMGAWVITNSWGYPVGTPTTDVVEDAIDTVARTGRDGKGTVILFAMNNIDQDDCIGSQPDISSLESVIAVSGANDQDKKVSFSAWGDCMEFLSTTFDDGRKGIASTDLTGAKGYNNGKYPGDLPDLDYTNDFGGTSAATPIAAGVFALMLSVNDQLTRNEALAMVLSTADKIRPDLANYDAKTGFSKKYGYGRIDAARAVRAAELFRKYTARDKAPVPERARTVRQ